eukprot:15351882-Ditylum_brightwellii.AAC.1
MAMDPTTGVAPIGGTDLKPQGIGLVEIEWKDDEGAIHKHKLEKALYLPESPVIIISVTCLVDQQGNDKGTFVTTK